MIPHDIYYRKCCRVWPLLHGYQVGTCGLCRNHPEEISIRSEYLAQLPFVPPIDDFSPLDLLHESP